jgi:hypothetical protein
MSGGQTGVDSPMTEIGHGRVSARELHRVKCRITLSLMGISCCNRFLTFFNFSEFKYIGLKSMTGNLRSSEYSGLNVYMVVPGFQSHVCNVSPWASAIKGYASMALIR